MKASTALKDQAARFARLFVVAFIAALAPAAIALKGPVDVKVVEAVVAGAAVGAAETAWRQLRPTVPAGSLVDVVEAAVVQAKSQAAASRQILERIQTAVASQPAAASPLELPISEPAPSTDAPAATPPAAVAIPVVAPIQL